MANSNDTARIELHGRVSSFNMSGFQYGSYMADNRKWLNDHIGECFNVVRHNINYWKLPNGFLVHVYECREMSWAFEFHNMGPRGL